MKKYSKQEILSAARILDIAKKLSIGLESISSGNFTHRGRCPSPEHKGGQERTGSLYVDGDNNNFYCFGCGASNNVIDFYMLKQGCDFSTALSEMSELVDPSKVSAKKHAAKKNNFKELMAISRVFRLIQERYPEDIEWIESFMKKTDLYLDQIDRYDVEKTKALYRKVSEIVKRRFS